MLKRALITLILSIFLLLLSGCTGQEVPDSIKDDPPADTRGEAHTEKNPDTDITDDTTLSLEDVTEPLTQETEEEPATEEYTSVSPKDSSAVTDTSELTSESAEEDTRSEAYSKSLNQVLSFLSENGLESFDSDSLSYNGKIYSPYYDSWFYSWQFNEGDFKGYEVNVEENAAERIYITSSEDGEKDTENTYDETAEETEQTIRKPSGQIIGYIKIDTDGKKTVKEFSGRVLGYYYPDRDVTTDHTGKIFARGDAASALLFIE